MLGEETIPAGEEAAIDRVIEGSLALMDKTGRPVRRDQHPKHHGCVRAEFAVEPDLPPEYRVGLFREPKTYPAWIRFSNGAQTDDRKADAHGMAVKLMGVDGEKLLDDEKHELTHDFVMVDNPVFFLRDAITYADFARATLKAKGKEKSLVRTLLFFLPGALRALVTMFLLYFFPRRLGSFRTLIKFASKRISSPLTTRYWSTTPYRYGPGVAMKFSAVPEVLGPKPPPGGSADYLREAMTAQLGSRDAVFRFQVQFQTDDSATPIEDPTVDWDAAGAPSRTVATIRIAAQTFDTAEQMTFCENLSFTPWHALPDHRPLGGINRTRKRVYDATSKLRHDLNGVPRREPTA